MKISIIGGGPCGTFLAYKLSKEGHDIHLYEKENYLGGCWGTKYVDGYFSEHSPKLFFNNYHNTIKFFEEIGIDFEKEFKKGLSTIKMSLSLVKCLSIKDIISLSKAMLLPLNHWKGKTVKDMIRYYDISKNGENELNNICYLIEGVSIEKMTTIELLDAFNKGFFYSQFVNKRKTDEFLFNKIENILKHNNVSIYLNTKIKNIPNLNQINFETNIETNSFKTNSFDKIIFCIPPKNFVEILKYSPKILKHNWGNFKSFYDLCNKSNYSGISIQYHFDPSLNVKIHWRKLNDPIDDWKIICDYKFNCLSCVLTDYTLVSTFLGKSINECSKHDISNEVFRMLKHNGVLDYNVIYKKYTIEEGTYRTYDTWKTSHDAFFKSKHIIDNINFFGNKDLGVYLVGTCNINKISPYIPFTSYESAITSAKLFLNQSNLCSNHFYVYKPFTLKYFLFFSFFFIALLFIFRFLRF